MHLDRTAHHIAYRIIIILGIVALLGDIIYEGARSISGPYLLTLGASAVLVGTITGAGEFLGYAVRLISGRVADSTRMYWVLTALGYGMLITVPLLAFTGSWEMAAVLFILERIGKGIRSPPKDTILSHATAPIGRGMGFGIHELLDQIGAVAGPVILAVALAGTGTYKEGFLLLFIPFIILIGLVLVAWRLLPDPVSFEKGHIALYSEATGIGREFIMFSVFTLLCTAGFLSFPLISFHALQTGLMVAYEIPLLYAGAMLVDAAIAPIAGRLYDTKGIILLLPIPLIGIILPFLGFGMGRELIFLSAILFGISMGIQETVLRAAIADRIHISKRGTAYGIFNTIYGAGFFIGGILVGWMYENYTAFAPAVPAMVSLAACIVFIRVWRSSDHQES
ncbi:MFS transporter [Methanospirillum hungatei]|mgnify:FL=1|jgi:MFS family permease|uniref:MFS transporter n=1 Tax=Methanospirillum hungatei TaxID=2203 RepID=UPI0009C548B2|nr:MFS transporter [Methanospirillum hungatei]MBP9007326.1 MFS transporter [Methanospirillum sp.]OQA58869.1 MAG: Major Facilitator Superfamily protein [Euryarchaeota archaeon ADurb.Bin294]HOW05979.1 MFS transporter [Methanospirillum hungatei]